MSTESNVKFNWRTTPSPSGYTWHLLDTNTEFSGSIMEANLSILDRVTGTVFKGEEVQLKEDYFSIEDAKEQMENFITTTKTKRNEST